PQPVPERPGLYRDPPFRELAIGCENCHGPGELHVARLGKGAIVNPAKLPSRLAEDICMNCHQGGDTRVLQPAKDYSDFRPGRPLIETLAIFRVPLKRGSPADSDLLEHHFSMQWSKCYRASGGRLSCLTCHNPHFIPSRATAPAYYRAKCLGCHHEPDCHLEERKRLQARNDCAGCHLPKREVAVISHSSLTNHRIVARPGQPYPDEASQHTTPELHDALPGLILVNRPAGSKTRLAPITLLRAYGELMEKEPAYYERYTTLLNQLSKTTPNDPLVLAALGRKILRESPTEPSDQAI